MESWRELRGLLIAVVVTLLRVHILCRIRKGVVFLDKASAAGVVPVTVAGVVDVDSASFAYFARVSRLLLLFLIMGSL